MVREQWYGRDMWMGTMVWKGCMDVNNDMEGMCGWEQRVGKGEWVNTILPNCQICQSHKHCRAVVLLMGGFSEKKILQTYIHVCKLL